MGEGVDHQRQDEPLSSQKQLFQQLPDRRRGTATRQGFQVGAASKPSAGGTGGLAAVWRSLTGPSVRSAMKEPGQMKSLTVALSWCPLGG